MSSNQHAIAFAHLMENDETQPFLCLEGSVEIRKSRLYSRASGKVRFRSKVVSRERNSEEPYGSVGAKVNVFM